MPGATDAKTLIDVLQSDPDWKSRVVHVEHFPAREPRYEAEPLHPSLAGVLKARGIDRLYTHQARAIRAIRAGAHTAVTTPTASGKSLIYLLPLWERRLNGDPVHALYLSPLKALAQDQRRLVEELGGHLPAAMRLSAALYDGDTSGSARAKVRGAPPGLVLSNPDMVHLSILAAHGAWAPFLKGLAYVVLDEAHTYRGVFGSHVSGLLRRLKRVCALYGSAPQFIVTSATMRNPDEFLRRLTGEPFTVIDESGAPAPPRYFALIKPHGNAYTETCELLERFLRSGLKTITFTKARKITELLSMWLKDRAPDLAPRVKSYRAGYLPEERRALERKLSHNELDGIISTSALELGIDIGGLDGCLLAGFPGTMLSTWQRAGRVGRGRRAALIALVGMEDALDLYYLAHPREFFDRGPERLLLDEANPAILKPHLVCAAAESPLTPADAAWFGATFEPLAAELAAEGRLMEAAAGRQWFSPFKQPQRLVNIRSAGESFLIENEQGEPLGTVDGFRAFKECHPAAIYLHGGTTYEIEKLNLDAKRVIAREAAVDHYTQAITTEETKVLKVRGTRDFGPGRLAWGDVRVTSRVVGYERKLMRGGIVLSRHELTLPPQEFETQAVWLMAPGPVQQLVAAPRDLMGSLHALEHVSIALFPLFALCDRWDLGGISTPHHADTGTATIFIYDGVPGGVGLAAFAYEIYGELLTKVAGHLRACDCEFGCPSCIHSPKCGSRNVPLDKAGAQLLADAFAGIADPVAERSVRYGARAPVVIEAVTPGEPRRELSPAGAVRPPGRSSPTGHTLFFDIETQLLAADVGGWDHKRDMKLSVAVVYDLEDDCFRDYMEPDAAALYADLAGAKLVVGFNVKSFDYEVLSAYVPRADWDALPTLDLLEEVHRALKRRVRLDDLAKATLNQGKIADGLDAVKWFRERNWTRLIEYCRHDVTVTKDLWAYGREHRHLLYPSVQGTMKVPAAW